jgi:hypothetical protein
MWCCHVVRAQQQGAQSGRPPARARSAICFPARRTNARQRSSPKEAMQKPWPRRGTHLPCSPFSAGGLRCVLSARPLTGGFVFALAFPSPARSSHHLDGPYCVQDDRKVKSRLPACHRRYMSRGALVDPNAVDPWARCVQAVSYTPLHPPSPLHVPNDWDATGLHHSGLRYPVVPKLMMFLTSLWPTPAPVR